MTVSSNPRPMRTVGTDRSRESARPAAGKTPRENADYTGKLRLAAMLAWDMLQCSQHLSAACLCLSLLQLHAAQVQGVGNDRDGTEAHRRNPGGKPEEPGNKTRGGHLFPGAWVGDNSATDYELRTIQGLRIRPSLSRHETD